jgi:hypothetical protein
VFKIVHTRCEAACENFGVYREDFQAFLCDTHAGIPTYPAVAEAAPARAAKRSLVSALVTAALVIWHMPGFLLAVAIGPNKAGL